MTPKERRDAMDVIDARIAYRSTFPATLERHYLERMTTLVLDGGDDQQLVDLAIEARRTLLAEAVAERPAAYRTSKELTRWLRRRANAS